MAVEIRRTSSTYKHPEQLYDIDMNVFFELYKDSILVDDSQVPSTYEESDCRANVKEYSDDAGPPAIEVTEDMSLQELYERTLVTIPGASTEPRSGIAETATWTNRPTVAVFNVGNLNRKPFRPGTSRAPASSSKKKAGVVYASPVEDIYNTLLKMIATCPAHFVAGRSKRS